MTDSTYESTPDSQSHERILRTDVLGRVQTPADLRDAILDEFEKSGLSGTKFAKARGLKYQTFATWVRGRRKERGEYPLLAQVAPETSHTSASLRDGECGEKSFTFVELTRQQSEPPTPSPNGEDRLLVELGDKVKIHVQNDQHILLAAKLIRSLS
jgi:hypothetical protein